MQKKKVLVVDDSVVVRTLVSEVIASDKYLEIAECASNGEMALEKIEKTKPDCVILDIEMPVMDGLETVRNIRQKGYRMPIIMYSNLTEKGAKVTFEAMALGATDYLTKPSNMASFDAGKQVMREQLLSRIYSLCGLCHVTPQHISLPALTPQPLPSPIKLCLSVPKKIDLVAIGISTGGPNALESVVPQLPEAFGAPVVIVQHMPPVFTKSLADRLNTKSKLHVGEAEDGSVVEAGKAWIAPGGKHTILARDGKQIKLRMNMDAPENSCRPSVDVMFRSAVNVFGSNILAIVMTGMGQDGLKGCEHIVKVGGQVIVQDEKTSVVWGMPGFVARAGLASKVLPLQDIATEIVARVCSKKEI